MITSEATNQLAAALALAQGQFPAIEKNRTGKVQTEKASFTYDYADLSDVLSAVRPILSKNGLAISHDAEVIYEPELSVKVTARLEHSSGQWRHSTPLTIPCDGKMGAAQLIGSADTYGRRYTTCSILGVVAESDDDGTIAGGQQAETTQRVREPKPLCISCGKNDFVYKDKEVAGKWFCWKSKGGCGANWQEKPAGETQSESENVEAPPATKTNGKKKPAPELQSDAAVLKQAVESISKCDSEEKHGKMKEWIEKKRTDGFLTDSDAKNLTAQLAYKMNLESRIEEAIH